MNKKIFIFLPDGVGLRNFAFTNFYKLGADKGFDIVFWNNTKFLLKEELEINEVKVLNPKLHFLTDLYKRAKIIIELKQNYKKTRDKTYLTYLFPHSYFGFKKFIKSLIVDVLVLYYNSAKGIHKVKNKIYSLERKTAYYRKSKQQLEHEKPDFIFCTNQRPIIAVAPLLAAKDLGIPTASFIFSWDNIPKATLVVKTDYYFVWSAYMKNELCHYYPEIEEAQIKITGTPQFEPHFDQSIIISKNDFFNKYRLDTSKKYICFSGDDITTSPYDQFYLRDVAETVRSLNAKGYNLGVIFRRCPVDISDRFDNILKAFQDVIVPLNPKWESFGENWNAIMPMPNDLDLLVNTVKHTEIVFNVGSSMVFDFVCQNKPCAFLNYNNDEVGVKKWNIETIYKFIHFKSMPSDKAVFWVDSMQSIENIILKGLEKPEITISTAKNWLDKINVEEPQEASKNIWNAINEILTCT